MKKIISLLLTFTILLSMLSVFAFAKTNTPDFDMGAVAAAMQKIDIKGIAADPFGEFVTAIEQLGQTDNYGRPGIVIPMDETKPNECYYMISVVDATGSSPARLEFLLRDTSNYSFKLLIDADLSGSYKWSIDTPNNFPASASGTTAITDTMNTTVTLDGSQGGIAISSTVELATELRNETVAFLHLMLVLLGLDYHFSDFGFNDKYFCPSGHDFSNYVYNGDATETQDGTKTAVCSECGIENTIVAEGTAGTTSKKTAFDKVADYLMLNRPSDYTLSATAENDGATAVYSISYNKNYDVLTTEIELDYEGNIITYSFDVNRELDGNYKCNFIGKDKNSGTILLTTSAKIPDIANGYYDVIHFTGEDEDSAIIQESYQTFTTLAVSFFYSIAKVIDTSLSISDFGFDKHFMCDIGHLVYEYTYNNDATYEKDGTKSGNCYFCNDTVTVQAIGSKLVDIKDTSKIFTDVKKGKWYKKAIDYCYSHGFIKGMRDNYFGLDEPVTRGMFITILARIAGVSTSGAANRVQTKFSDVKSGKYYTAAIKWASENGIVNGTSKTEFSPDDNITREQICVMLVNFAYYIDVDLTPTATATGFTDSSKISSWAEDEVSICQEAEIILGIEQNGRMYFKPQDFAKRSEAAQMLYKFHSKFVNIY